MKSTNSGKKHLIVNLANSKIYFAENIAGDKSTIGAALRVTAKCNSCNREYTVCNSKTTNECMSIINFLVSCCIFLLEYYLLKHSGKELLFRFMYVDKNVSLFKVI